MARALRPDRCEEVTELEGFRRRFDDGTAGVDGGFDSHPSQAVVQGLDLTGSEQTAVLLRRTWSDVVFLGCPMSEAAELHVIKSGATVFPPFEDIPFSPYRGDLYTTAELAAGGLDERIYRHQAKFRQSGHIPILEALAQRIHDHAIDTALHDYLAAQDRVVAIMGGHTMLRGDDAYSRVAQVSCQLTREGYLVVTGGGPGAMEAGNLGAWLAPAADDALGVAIDLLAEATDYTTEAYFRASSGVLERYPDGAASLAIPTWFYGHEPTNSFATAVAKYFSNSIREDGLLAIATSGVVYTPGAAGTVQEVFMDATQNHYATFGVISPMVFLDSDFWADDNLGAPRLLRQLSSDRDYGSMITVLDDPDEIVAFIENNPPRKP